MLPVINIFIHTDHKVALVMQALRVDIYEPFNSTTTEEVDQSIGDLDHVLKNIFRT